MADQIVRPAALSTERTSPVASEWMVVDNEATVARATIQKVVEAGRPTATQPEAEAGTDPSKAMTPLTTKQAIQAQGDVRFASAAQGALADSAVQPSDLATVATTGDYNDLSGKPTLGSASAQDSSAFATAAQGALADTAVQPGDLALVATTGSYNDLIDKPISPGSAAPSPQGRLSLAATSPVTISDIAAATVVYYVPSGGVSVPILSGGQVQVHELADGLSLPLDANAAHDGYHEGGKAFDFFIAVVGGAVRLCTGPAWSSLTDRGSGTGTTELEYKAGLQVNKNTINLRYGIENSERISVLANEATWVGSFLATADGVSTDTRQRRYLFNGYNMANRPIRYVDTVNGYIMTASPDLKALNNDYNNRVAVFLGLEGVTVNLEATAITIDDGAAGRYRDFAFSLDGTNIAPNSVVNRVIGAAGQMVTQEINYADSPGLGFSAVIPMMRTATGGVTWYGNASGLQSGVTGWVLM